MKLFRIGAGLLLTVALGSANLEACTGIALTAKDGSVVHGRTAEFGTNLDFSAVVMPRGYQFTGTAPNGKGMSYKSKYGVVGMIAFGEPAIMDGMNEKGLSVGAFYFPGYASYTPITSENQSKALSPIDFSNWILASFATLDEVKAALPSVVIAPTVLKNWGPTPPPMHYIVYDKSGKSIVIEPLDGKLVVRDNPIGVITNSPEFDWHMTYLRNFIDLSPFNTKPVMVNGVKLSSFGQGSGLVGLPGDFSPPSRFVRAAVFTASAIPSKNSQEAVLQAFHILNQFDIPVGAVRAKENGEVYEDSTLATAVRDPQSLQFFFRTYNDQSIHMVDLNKFDLDGKQIKTLATSNFKQPIVDISSELK